MTQQAAEEARRVAVHELKTWPEYFHPLWEGLKHFEIRKNDRGFQVGDVLWLREYDPFLAFDRRYSGRELKRTIIYMTGYQQADDRVVLGLDINAALLQAQRAAYEDMAQHMTLSMLHSEDTFTATAFNDACRDFIDYCHKCAAAIRQRASMK